MTLEKMHIAVNIGVQQVASHVNRGLEPREVDYFLNRNILLFVKQRFSEFEKSSKRIQDLKNLVVEETVSAYYGDKRQGFFYDIIPFPTDYFLLVGQYCNIVTSQSSITVGDNQKQIGTALDYQPRVKWIEQDDISETLFNPFSKPRTDLLIGTIYDEGFRVFTPATIVVDSMFFTYLKKPIEVNYTDAPEVSCDLNESVHDEIIDMTVKDILLTWNKLQQPTQ